MKVVELKALMAATIAAGYRANPHAYSREPCNAHAVAEWALADAEAILLLIGVTTPPLGGELNQDFGFWLANGHAMQAERQAEDR